MALELLRIPALFVNEELSIERKNEIKLTDNYKNILYHINLMHTPLVMREEKKRKFISHAIFCISRVNTTLFTSRSCLLLMVNMQT